jgi:hypothetical protein
MRIWSVLPHCGRMTRNPEVMQTGASGGIGGNIGSKITEQADFLT